MKKTTKKTDRREFLKGSIQALVIIPAVITTTTPAAKAKQVLDDAPELLPGDAGYRDEEAYGSVAG